MAEEGLRINASSSGLAVLLTDSDLKGASQKSHLVTCCDDIGDRSVERTLEHIFDLPYRSIHPSKRPLDAEFVCSLLRLKKPRFQMVSELEPGTREGLVMMGHGRATDSVGLEEKSICGELRILQQPFLVESFAMFSSARANTCVWKGKWMYEVTLETSGIQQLGWTTLACPFTDRKGVGDAEDSYAFDGKRVSKWNKEAKAYGQPWVVGDVIGCCIDLEACEISFYRNGVSLGVAFEGVRRTGIGLGYYPAISLSEGERCNLNFGDRPFMYPIDGFLPLQLPPSSSFYASYLLQCLSKLLELQSIDKFDLTSRRLKRSSQLKELFCPVSHGICQEFFSVIEEESSKEYVAWGALTSFLLRLFGKREPHDSVSLDRVMDLFLEFRTFHSLFRHVIMSLSCSCRTTPLILTDCPFTGSCSFLSLACHMLRREELMILWWKSADFEYSLEGFLSRKGPSKLDLQLLIPSVWWLGSSEDMFSEASMTLTTASLSAAVNKMEELHRELCRLVIQFVPPITPSQSPGYLFRTFLQNFILKVIAADHKGPSAEFSGDSAVVSLYMVMLHFLSEGFAVQNLFGLTKGSFLHRGGQRRYPVELFFNTHLSDTPRLGGSFTHLLKSHPASDEIIKEVHWNEGYVNDECSRITHSTREKPCCCSSSDIAFARTSKDPIRYNAKSSKGPCSPISERSARVAAECSTGSLNDEIVDKPSTSNQSEPDFGCRVSHHLEYVSKTSHLSSDLLREEELLDCMLLFYHLGVTPNLKQAFYYMTHLSQSISLLDDTDRLIREKTCSEQLKRLKEARNIYREELVDCVRQCAWYRANLLSQWKQRGMYASCIWISELLLVLSKNDSLFIYVPEFYLEAVVDCFHALRRSEPPFVSSAVFIKQGLASFVSFIVAHFDDPRISSLDIKDLLLQSISVLVQYKDYLASFEDNKEAIQKMPKALLSAFDNRSWILVTNILVRLCKGSGFASSKHGESSSSTVFQGLLRDACIQDEAVFSCFLNRLFNTLSWTMTEFSVSIREMQENRQIAELQQRKCSVIFDLSCSLTRVLEFCTREVPQAFLLGTSMNLQRLTELIVFILNHIISAVDSEFFDMSLRRHGQNPEKTNRAMILAPLVGIILNIVDAATDSSEGQTGQQNDVIDVFASMDCPTTIHCGVQYLLGYNWGSMLRGDASLVRLAQLEQFLSCLTSRTESGGGRGGFRAEFNKEEEEIEAYCCICYACISDARFEPCHHMSCFSCITRHLLNSQRCFFCNATVTDVMKIDATSSTLETSS